MTTQTGVTSKTVLIHVSMIAVSMTVGAILGIVFINTLNGAYNKPDTKQLMQEYGALDLSQAHTSGGLVFGH